MADNAIDYQAIAESMRRGAGQMPSSAGVPGGAATMNQPAPNNPAVRSGQMPNQPVPAAGALPTPGNSMNPSSGAISAMQNAQPGEAQIIVKALINRLKSHPVAGQLPQPMMGMGQ